MSMSSGSSTPLTSSANRSSRKSLSTTDSSVTHLLVSTKHLLESLNQWAKQEADDKFVSDAYVKLGNDFRAATRAFTNAGVDVSDIGDVPQALRIILEAALSEAPSQENLDRFLPNIRNIIVTLLQNLKSKQSKAKSLSLDKQRQKASDSNKLRSSSTSSFSPSPRRQPIPRKALPDKEQLEVPQDVEVPHELNSDTNLHYASPHRDRPASKSSKDDALTQLQKGNALQRRASKRFSAYQYAKLTSFNHSNNLPRLSSGEVGTQKTPNSSFDIYEEALTPPKPATTQTSQESSEYLFLQIGDKTKKVYVTLPVSFASLRLLFVEKFAYSPGTASFPEMSIKDPHTGISYELEDHMLDTEVKPGCLLCLNEPGLQEQHLKSLEDKVSLLSTKMESFTQDIGNEIKSAIASIEIPKPTIEPPIVSKVSPITTSSKGSNYGHIKSLKQVQHEIQIIKQLHSVQKLNLKKSFQDIIERVSAFQKSGSQILESSDRSYMNKSNNKLSEESDLLLTKVDDLQDTMEALRKDVAQRGVRVSDQLLKNTQREIEEAKSLLRNLSEYILAGKPTWKKIWEAELDKVCEEQQFFNLQDDLTRDLEEDIKKIEETFELIEKCSTEQSKQGTYKRNKVVANLYIPQPGESLHGLKDAVMNEVAALVPDHSGRLEAIEKAEKLRQKERELSLLTKFQKELGGFVEDGKLKKSGGIEELERTRQQKDLENIKSSFGII